MSQKTLNLLFPQWQGSGIGNELYYGAMLIQEYLKDREFDRVPVSLDRTLKLENNILGYSPILQQLSQAREIIEQHNPDRLFVIGGDCSIDIAPISFLDRKYNGNLAVIWIDAHADLNTPISSPSKHFHGMPLRVLLGEGDAEVIATSFSILSPSQVFLVGARDFDPPEKNYLERQNMALFPPHKLEHDSQSLIDTIANANFQHGSRIRSLFKSISSRQNIHIHCDLDAIAPEEFPFVKCPVANGLSIELLNELLQQLSNRFNVVGFSITEFAPHQKRGLEKIAELVNKMFSQFQNRS